MDRTLELRRELEIKLQRVTQLMEAASVNSKSQRYEQIGCSASTVVDNEESESESSSDSDSGSSSESEDEDVSIDPRRRFLLQHTKDVENDVGNCAGGLFTGRNKLSTKFSRLLSQLSIPENGNDEPEEANLEESKPKHDGPIPTEQLNKARGRSEMVTSERTPLLSKPLNAAANEKCAPLVRSAGPPPKKLPAYYAIMLNDVKQVPIQLRAPCVSHALLLLKKAMMTDAVGEQKADISDSIGGVLDWITESSDLEHDFELYHDFAIVLFSYTLQHPETEELQR
ncbi:hypothetical protein AM587_10005864 [Phytophthora nicotianae]|uniref:Uncharacterized protein n=1 Tax=Phytophthora nicotianae TaxID=4792 RepID=A0A0W8CX45_PHYNI|nr:hypothetical protein AM587_10005864 [Phytophthora nicotianae]